METLPTPSGVETVPAMVAASARRYWKRPALWRWVDVGFEPVTYGELLTAVSALAARLKDKGSGPGKRVAVAITDRFGWGVAYLGVLFTGATVVPIDPLLTGSEIGPILSDADVAMVVHDGRIDLGRCDYEYSTVTLKSIWPGFAAPSEPSEPPLPDITADDLAEIIFTSGTTGQTKGVMLTHGNLVTDVIGVASMGLCYDTDILLSVLPIHHAFECTAGFLYPLAIGGQVAYARSLKSKEILADLRSTQATVILAVPLLFENIVNSIQRKAGNAPPLKRALFQTLVAISRKSRNIGWRGYDYLEWPC